MYTAFCHLYCSAERSSGCCLFSCPLSSGQQCRPSGTRQPSPYPSLCSCRSCSATSTSFSSGEAVSTCGRVPGSEEQVAVVSQGREQSYWSHLASLIYLCLFRDICRLLILSICRPHSLPDSQQSTAHESGI